MKLSRATKAALLIFLLMAAPAAFAGSLYQDTNRFSSGFRRVVGASFQLPFRVLQGTLYGPPISGTLSGALGGTFQTVTDLAGGTFDMAAAAAPYAKYAVLFA